MTDLSYKYLLHACDIVIVFKKKNSLVRLFNKFIGKAPCHYTTANIFLFLFDDLCVDITSFGIQNRTLFPYNRDITTIFIARYTDITFLQKNFIIERALTYNVTHASILNRNTKKSMRSCTKFIAQCFYDAGIILFPGKDLSEITINDFLDCSFLEKIIVNECK
jgi:hypothetical protein